MISTKSAKTINFKIAKHLSNLWMRLFIQWVLMFIKSKVENWFVSRMGYLEPTVWIVWIEPIMFSLELLSGLWKCFWKGSAMSKSIVSAKMPGSLIFLSIRNTPSLKDSANSGLTMETQSPCSTLAVDLPTPSTISSIKHYPNRGKDLFRSN